MRTIREYEERDWIRICRIHDRARPDELHGSCDPRAFIPIAEDPEVADLRRAHKYVACEGEQVVGFVGVADDYLAWLYVDPDRYGRGIGRQLLRRALMEMGPHAWTIVLAGNRRAVHLYESEGFREVDRFEGENAGYPCTCLRMELAG
jgi:ribosomal protein S18 acetylase RimI-like enzyme